MNNLMKHLIKIVIKSSSGVIEQRIVVTGPKQENEEVSRRPDALQAHGVSEDET